MANTQQYSVRDEVLVAAPVEEVRSLVEDVVGWTQLHKPAVHAAVLADSGDEQLVRHWAVAGRDSVRIWTTRRTRDADGSRISFVHQDADASFASLAGAWTFQEQGGKTLVGMSHDFTPADGAEAQVEALSARLRTGARDYLRTLGHAAENRAELDRLIISFTDALFIAGDVKDAYDYLWEADKW